MIRLALFSGLIALAGCVESEPPRNSALEQMQAACDQGNLDACGAVLNYQGQRQQALALGMMGSAPTFQPVTVTPYVMR